MQCKKCGTMLLETDKFCKICGEPVIDTNLTNENNQPSNMQNNMQNTNSFFAENNQESNNVNNQLQPNEPLNNWPEQNNANENSTIQNNVSENSTIQNNNQPIVEAPVADNNKEKKKMPVVLKVLAIIGGIIVGLIAIVVVLFLIVSSNSDKMVCEFDGGNITIMYNENGLTGYTVSGVDYDFDTQKEYASQIGVDAYLKEFNSWITKNMGGSCTINGEKVEGEEEPATPTSSGSTNTTVASDTQVVGDEKYGYITIPKNWYRFYDVDGNTSLQYSYASVYIVTLDVVDSQTSAKTAASNFMYNMQQSSEVTGVTGATVTVGKNNEYTAYQIYMYYPSSATFLVTYWLEAEDGKVHYIAIEGPQELSGVKLTDYLYIPESFSLTNKM